MVLTFDSEILYENFLKRIKRILCYFFFIFFIFFIFFYFFFSNGLIQKTLNSVGREMIGEIESCAVPIEECFLFVPSMRPFFTTWSTHQYYPK